MKDVSAASPDYAQVGLWNWINAELYQVPVEEPVLIVRWWMPAPITGNV